MNEHRRFQFGLRKLLLWTAVVALYLGLLKVFNFELSFAIFLTCWVAAIVVFQAVFGPRVAAWPPIVVGILVAAVSPLLGRALVVEAISGLVLVGVVQLAFHFANRADDLLRRREPS